MKKIIILILAVILSAIAVLPTTFADTNYTIEYPFSVDQAVVINRYVLNNRNENFSIVWTARDIRIAIWSSDLNSYSIYVSNTSTGVGKTVDFTPAVWDTIFLLRLYWSPVPYNGVYPVIDYIPLGVDTTAAAQITLPKLHYDSSKLTIGDVETNVEYDSSVQYAHYPIRFEGYWVGNVDVNFQPSNLPQRIEFMTDGIVSITEYNPLIFNLKNDRDRLLDNDQLIDNFISNITISSDSAYDRGYTSGYTQGFNDADNGGGSFWGGAIVMIRTFGNALVELGNVEIGPNIKLSYIAIGIPVLMLIVGLILRRRG